jgi:phosphatidylserine decarboxylase
MMKISVQERINFLLCNRIPRRWATRWFGWFSRIEHPVVSSVSLAIWRRCADLELHEAEETEFRSLHACFIRRLRPGARPIDTNPRLLVSPCDAIIGACGQVEDGQVLQIKGFPYRVDELFADAQHARFYQQGCYVTLRLTSSMYHRFHAPHDCRVRSTTYIAGDTWNVNPAALRRIERLFCQNERAVIAIQLSHSDHVVTLVPVAAILVASLRFSYFGADFDLRRHGPAPIRSDIPLAKGAEMGWFQHGSTIIMFAPRGFSLCEGVKPGAVIRMGRPLMRLPSATSGAVA